MCITGNTVGLAKWIIDETCLVIINLKDISKFVARSNRFSTAPGLSTIMLQELWSKKSEITRKKKNVSNYY